jgi:hypothetical protein
MSTEALHVLAEADEKALRFKAGFPEEVLPQADIINHNTRNSFQSLPEDKKASARVRAGEARERMRGAGAEGVVP